MRRSLRSLARGFAAGLAAGGLAWLAGCQAPPDLAQRETAAMSPLTMAIFEGHITYRTRQALPATAELRVRLLDCGRVTAVSAPAPVVIAAASQPAGSAPPWAFILRYAAGDIVGDHRYRLEAEVVHDGRVLLRSPASFDVITNARFGPVEMVLSAPDAVAR